MCTVGKKVTNILKKEVNILDESLSDDRVRRTREIVECIFLWGVNFGVWCVYLEKIENKSGRRASCYWTTLNSRLRETSLCRGYSWKIVLWTKKNTVLNLSDM